MMLSERQGRMLTTSSLDDAVKFKPPSWRGWLIGLTSVTILCRLLPYTDFFLQGTRLTLSLLPFASFFILFGLILTNHLFLTTFRRMLRLSQQDLALIFCMTLVATSIPGYGFVGYCAGEMSGMYNFATPENRWAENLLPFVPQELTPPPDPVDINSTSPRAIEWLYNGLPKGQEIPWSAWIAPYSRWALMMLLLYGMFFAACGLVHHQWADHEQLPFPLAQAPIDLLSTTESGATPAFFKDRLAWLGIGLVFLINVWNGLGDYVESWPIVSLRTTEFGWNYLTEPPWNGLNPVWIIVAPSVIGLTYYVSTEVSFSLWFFYWVLKACVLIAIGLGYGNNHWDFIANLDAKGWKGTFTNQGTGALLALLVANFWIARHALWRSLGGALRLNATATNSPDAVSPTVWWLVLANCFAGSVWWLVSAGVGWGSSLLAVSTVLLIAMGVARLVSEGGIIYPQVVTSPMELTFLATPPTAMGVSAIVPFAMWNRLAAFDYFRLVPSITLLTALQVGRATGVRQRPLVVGVTVAVLLSLVLGFYGFFTTLYHNNAEGNKTYLLHTFPQWEYSELGKLTSTVLHYQKKQEKLAEQGERIPAAEIPDVARRDMPTLWWILVGAVMLAAMTFLRARLSWWPHPIGYVMWTGQRTITALWFSFFIGWAIKSAIVKFGGIHVYRRWRNFFLGFVVGEVLAAFLWIGVAWLTGLQGGYSIFNGL